MLVRRELEGSPRHLAWLYSPPRLRAVLEALLGMEAEIRAALESGLEHRVAHVRLEWWREECARCTSGTPVHPLTRALVAACDAPAPAGTASSPAAGPDPGGLIETAVWDLASATFATRAEITDYCDRWAAAVTRVAAEAAARAAAAARADRAPEFPGEEAAHFGRRLGAAIKEIELLADLAADARLGRLRLPLDELERADVEPSALSRPPWPPGLCHLLRARHQALRAALEATVAVLPPAVQPSVRGLLVWAALAHRGSLRAERALPGAWQPSRANRLADAWIGWRAARRADRQEFRLR